MKKLCSIKKIAFFAITLFCFATAGIAQTETARISGSVSDANGAALSGATITIKSLATGREVKTVAGDDGSYSVLSLQPGRYAIEVGQANFKTLKQEITLEVAQNADLNFTLEAGAVSETVTVTSDIPQVDTSTSAISQVVSGREAVELPLNGRNVLELARLTPGVTQGIPSGFASGVSGNAETYRGRNTGGAAISVNGQRTQANNFLLDGVDNNESLVNTINVFPSAEAIQEFRVQTSVASAEFGRGGGGIINSVIKSGTNDFHGSAFGFFRNDGRDARVRFENDRRDFRRDQFGATLGGPIWKNKAFFFTDYEGLNQTLPVGKDFASVPTAGFRTGNFSALNQQLRDPLTGQNICVTGTTTNGLLCTNGNGIAFNRLDLLPGSRLNAVGLRYLQAFPLPNFPTNPFRQNYEATRNENTNTDTFDIRGDVSLNTNNQMFGRYSWGKFRQTTTSRLPDLPAGFGSGTNPTDTRGAVVGLNSVVSAKLVNEFRLQVNRISFGYTPPFFDRAISADLGIPNANRDANLGGGALIGGYNGDLEYTGDFGPYLVPQSTYQIVDSMSYTTGTHTFKFGGTILRRDVALYRPNRGKGYFFLIGNGDPTQCGNAASTGFEQADLLIGFVCNYQIGPPFGTVGTRNWENGFFAQDDWKVNSKLTLNLGLRYEYFTNPTEMYARQANFDLATGRLIVAADNKDSLTETDRNNFGPRLGFAYDLNGDGKSTIRGGYGLFYFLDRGGIDNQLAQNPPYSGFSQFNYTDGVRITLSGRCANNTLDSRNCTGALPLGSVSDVNLANPQNVTVLAIKPDNKTSNIHQFNIQYQRQLTDDTAFSVAYVGTRGRNLSLYYNLNGNVREPGTNVACPNGRTTAPCYTNGGRVNVRDDNGKSQYDSLQFQMTRRFSKGWQYRLAYTYSKTKDNGEGAFDSVADLNLNFLEPFATSRSDFPHVLSFESVYEIPFGRGRKYGSDSHKAVDLILGGWQINGIFRAQSGQTFDVRRDGVRVDLVGDPYTNNFDPFSSNQYLNRAAFQNAPAGRFGNLERNGLRGPSGTQLNMGLLKDFGITERVKLQFRGEVFNVFNTASLTPPNTDLNNTSTFNGFGTIRSVYAFTNRQIQFGARLQF
jgi:outer membrane receptor protein involved in Fe transport